MESRLRHFAVLRARERLGWTPRVTFPALVRSMVEHDVALARRERTLKNAGYIEIRGAASEAKI